MQGLFAPDEDLATSSQGSSSHCQTVDVIRMLYFSIKTKAASMKLLSLFPLTIPDPHPCESLDVRGGLSGPTQTKALFPKQA